MVLSSKPLILRYPTFLPSRIANFYVSCLLLFSFYGYFVLLKLEDLIYFYCSFFLDQGISVSKFKMYACYVYWTQGSLYEEYIQQIRTRRNLLFSVCLMIYVCFHSFLSELNVQFLYYLRKQVY